MVRIIVTIFIVIINMILQSTLIPAISFGGIGFNLLVITVASFGLLKGKMNGAIMGLAIGFLYDIFFGSTVGFYTLIYFYVGFFCGYLNKSFYRDNIFIPIAIISLGDFIQNIVIYLFSYMLRGRTDISYYMNHIILPELVYTAFVSIFIYKIYMVINDKLETREKRRADRESSDDYI